MNIAAGSLSSFLNCKNKVQLYIVKPSSF